MRMTNDSEAINFSGEQCKLADRLIRLPLGVFSKNVL